jgi:hypothetical protein
MTIKPKSFEYNLLFTLIILIIAVTLILLLFLGKEVLKKRKELGYLSMDFLFGNFVAFACLFISRLFYMYFDFFLTKFDTSKYILPENLWAYKVGGLIYLSGFSVLLFIIDKNLLSFKLKGILSYIIIAIALFVFLYPVNSTTDFEFISAVEMIAFFIGLLIPAIFFYIGIKNPGLRFISYVFAIGIILFYIGIAIVAEFILAPLRESFGTGIQITMWIISLILQIVGLISMTYASIKFK